ncbi:MAG: BatA and WFA domain-containing protein [Arenicellales bacterium]|nr:BatA and WFA domain-containing protein [Arenicellales bacterium]
MGLLTPWFLVGFMAVSVPILLHLVQRKEPAGQPFPSLMFLRRIPVKTRRKKTLRDPILLILRCLALVLLALAFAGPYLLSNKTVVATTTNKVDRVFLLDQSYSMAYPGHWTTAIDAVREQIGELTSGERAAIVAFDNRARLIEGFTADRARLQTAIEQLRPRYSETNYAAALASAERVLRDSSAQRQEVVLVSDLQRVGLSGLRTPRLNAETDLRLIPIGPAAGSNAAVMSVELAQGGSGVGEARHVLKVRARNTGSKAAHGVRLASTVEDRENGSYIFDLEAGAEHTLQIPLLIATDRATRVQIQLSPDGIAVDDVFYLTLAGEQPTTVMLVGPDAGDTHAGFYLTQALALAQAPEFDIVDTAVSDLDQEVLAGADVVILDDVRLPDDAGRQSLSDFVARGGGLLVVAADGPRGQWPGGDQGFLPGQLGQVVKPGSGVGRWVTAGDVHPLLDALRGASVEAFADAEVYRYRNLIATNDDRVLAHFDDGAPALVERTNRSGRVLVMTTTLDPRWSSLAFTSSFAPFLIETVRYLAYRPRSDSHLWIGDSLDLFEQVAPFARSQSVADSDQPQSMVVESPEGQTIRLSRNKALYSPQLPGFHELHQAALENESLPIAVNANRAESNLAALSAEQFYEAIMRPQKLDRAAMQDSTSIGVQANADNGVWWIVLAIAVLLLLTEALLANRLTVRATVLSQTE